MDNSIYEVLYELAEDENDDLRTKIKALEAYISVLEKENIELAAFFNSLINLNNRLN